MKIQISEHFNYRKLIRFTIPTIVMLIFTSIYGVVDGIFISNCTGSDSFAAVNLIMPAIMILGALGFMIGTGGSALVSKTLGEGKAEKANQYFSMLIYFLAIIGITATIIGFFLLPSIAKALGAKDNILKDCIIYGRTLLIAIVPFMLQNCFQSFLVVAERPGMGLKISILAGVTNMLLDFLLVYVLKMGVFGAALATGISQFVGASIPLFYFLRKKTKPLHLIKVKFEARPLLKSCTNGSSEMLTNLSLSLVNMLYNMQLMKLVGTDGVAAYGIIMYVAFIFSGTYIGYSVGVSPIIGYHYGAGNKEELKGLLKKSLFLIAITAVIMTVLAEMLSEILAGIFVSYDKDLLEMTTTAIRLYSLSFMLNGFNIFGSALFTALNNGAVSALISFLRTLVFQVAMILILPVFLELNGIWLAIVAAEFWALLVTIVCIIANRKNYQYL